MHMSTKLSRRRWQSGQLQTGINHCLLSWRSYTYVRVHILIDLPQGNLNIYPLRIKFKNSLVSDTENAVNFLCECWNLPVFLYTLLD